MNYDQFIAALCIWREARGCSMAAKTGVWHVIQNRAADPQRRWATTLAGVVLQPYQFSSFNQHDPNSDKFPVPNAPLEWQEFQDCMAVVNSPLDADPTEGANMYHSFTDPAKFPKWADPAKATCTIGPFHFYKL